MNSKPINSAHCDYSAYSSDDDFDNNGIRGQTKRPAWFTEGFSFSTCEPGESSQAAAERAAAAKRLHLEDKAYRYETISGWLNEKSVAWAAEEGISSEETR